MQALRLPKGRKLLISFMIGTSEIGLYATIINHTNFPRRVVLIDTPGFDDVNRSDSDILQNITYILSQTYEQGIRLTGIIYLIESPMFGCLVQL